MVLATPRDRGVGCERAFLLETRQLRWWVIPGVARDGDDLILATQSLAVVGDLHGLRAMIPCLGCDARARVLRLRRCFVGALGFSIALFGDEPGQVARGLDIQAADPSLRDLDADLVGCS